MDSQRGDEVRSRTMTKFEAGQLGQSLIQLTSSYWSGEEPFTKCETCKDKLCLWCVDCKKETCTPCATMNHEGCSLQRMQPELYSFRLVLASLDPELAKSISTAKDCLKASEELKREVEKFKAALTTNLKRSLIGLIEILNDLQGSKHMVNELYPEFIPLETQIKKNIEFWSEQKHKEEQTASLMSDLNKCLKENVVKRDQAVKVRFEKCKTEIEKYMSESEELATQQENFDSSSKLMRQKLLDTDMSTTLLSWISDKLKTRISAISQHAVSLVNSQLLTASGLDIHTSGVSDRNLLPLMQTNLTRNSGSGGSD